MEFGHIARCDLETPNLYYKSLFGLEYLLSLFNNAANNSDYRASNNTANEYINRKSCGESVVA